jgi:hypothetical protein
MSTKMRNSGRTKNNKKKRSSSTRSVKKGPKREPSQDLEDYKEKNAKVLAINLFVFLPPYRSLTHFVQEKNYPTSTRRHGNFAGVHTLLRILLSSNSAVLINIITGVSPPHYDFVVYYVLCQC